MRLIDADELNWKMYHDAFETDTDMQKWDGGCWIRYKMFENAIKTVNIVQVYCPNCGSKMDMDIQGDGDDNN